MSVDIELTEECDVEIGWERESLCNLTFYASMKIDENAYTDTSLSLRVVRAHLNITVNVKAHQHWNGKPLKTDNKQLEGRLLTGYSG